MGIFTKRKSEIKVAKSNEPTAIDSRKNIASTTNIDDEEATISMAPQLIKDIEKCVDTSGDKPARALRMLFALSEHASDLQNRTAMARIAGGQLIPVLLHFLRRCDRGSSEQYLVLLVLNNISIPSKNKRWIAIECGGARIFADLLCEDPSCHLMAIILVNLTFADVDLRKEFVNPLSCIQIVESLAYALRVSSLTHEEYKVRQPLPCNRKDAGILTPKQYLEMLMSDDKRIRPEVTAIDYNSNHNFRSAANLIDPSNIMYPETARWCLTAMKNLTRPAKNATTAQLFIDVGIVPLILRLICVCSSRNSLSPEPQFGELSENQEFPPNSTNSTPSASVPSQYDDIPEFTNSALQWDSNSIQDAALFVILNICAFPGSGEYILEMDTVKILSLLAESQHATRENTDKVKQLKFQCLKARISLSYLVGSAGHFGQPRMRSLASAYSRTSQNNNDAALLATETEIYLLVELLANTIHQRAKSGRGGYSVATFNTKGVILAIRCLLTHTTNQIRFASASGSKLNVLLLKVLAKFAIQEPPSIDSEAAENACFSLYLLSNLGFQAPFLPSFYGDHDNITGERQTTAKVLTSYLRAETITPAGSHAAHQLLLRLRFLIFCGPVGQVAQQIGDQHGASLVLQASDFIFEKDLIEATEAIKNVETYSDRGAKPGQYIFDRPILRSLQSKSDSPHGTCPWDNKAAVKKFPNALQAVQDFSFGSTKVRHMDAIDDIAIANNIAKIANGENGTESYNYYWRWQDDNSKGIQRNDLDHHYPSGDSIFSSSRIGRITSSSKNDEPMSILGFSCGPTLCCVDNTCTSAGEEKFD